MTSCSVRVRDQQLVGWMIVSTASDRATSVESPRSAVQLGQDEATVIVFTGAAARFGRGRQHPAWIPFRFHPDDLGFSDMVLCGGRFPWIACAWRRRARRVMNVNGFIYGCGRLAWDWNGLDGRNRNGDFRDGSDGQHQFANPSITDRAHRSRRLRAGVRTSSAASRGRLLSGSASNNAALSGV